MYCVCRLVLSLFTLRFRVFEAGVVTRRERERGRTVVRSNLSLKTISVCIVAQKIRKWRPITTHCPPHLPPPLPTTYTRMQTHINHFPYFFDIHYALSPVAMIFFFCVFYSVHSCGWSMVPVHWALFGHCLLFPPSPASEKNISSYF